MSRPPDDGRLPPTAAEPTSFPRYLQDVARISYVDPSSLTDRELVEEMAFSQRYGTPRPETQSIRSHVPDVAKAFSRGWNRIFRQGIVEHPLKELCFAYVTDPDTVDVAAYEGRERVALEWAHAIVWDADASTDELWSRLHASFSEEELVELGCAIGFELGRTHFLRTLGADPSAVRASQLP